jgi:hypothetical protein
MRRMRLYMLLARDRFCRFNLFQNVRERLHVVKLFCTYTRFKQPLECRLYMCLGCCASTHTLLIGLLYVLACMHVRVCVHMRKHGCIPSLEKPQT